MKLDGTIILTLTDFKREFSLDKFWAVRRQFIRDMHPDKVYYCNDSDKELYFSICKWIESENGGETDGNIRELGLNSLSALTGRELSLSSYLNILKVSDLTQDIIIVRSGVLKLPGNIMAENDAKKFCKENHKKECLHKIEVEEGNENSVTIYINGTEVYTLSFGECVYVTEIDGRFLRILSSAIEYGGLKCYLINHSGNFCSDLYIEDYFSGDLNIEVIKSITHFAIERGQIKTSHNKYYEL